MDILVHNLLLARATDLIESRTGLAVGSLLRNDMMHVIERLSGGDLATWLKNLENNPEDSPVWQYLLASFTIGETYFMRDSLQLQLLREKVLPLLILRRREKNNLTLNFWSIGCATGEEPYSIAMMLQEFLPDIDRWKITIIGTDINTQALEQAQRARYRTWSFRHTSGNLVKRYFTLNQDGYDLREDIRDMVTFVRGNLLNPPPAPPMDVIFCRNVLIYFTTAHIRQAEENIYKALDKEGWLLLGSAEALRFHRERWQIHAIPNAPLYQKTRTPTSEFARVITTQTLTKPLIAIPDEAADCSPAIEAIRQDDYDYAEALLAQILLKSPRDSRAHTLQAFIFASRKAYPEALSHLDIALKADATFSDAYYLKAVIFNEQSKIDDMSKMLQATLYYHRDHMLGILLLGTLYTQEGDIGRAYKLWRRGREVALKLNPNDPIADFSEMTIGQYLNLLNSRLDE
jgi:chemotaxis protein methyltransferase CheR